MFNYMDGKLTVTIAFHRLSRELQPIVRKPCITVFPYAHSKTYVR